MGICTRRHFLLSVCILQLISTVIRQVFDFLGYMWIPILINFFEIIFIIFGFFGAFQYQPKYVISYSVWNLVLLAWNLFLVCLYLDIGILNHQESKVLKLDQESSSWWESNGPGCNVIYNTTGLPRPAKVTDCFLDYVHVEVFQASFQCLLAFLGCITGLCLGSTYLEKDDSFDGDCSTPELDLHPMYVSETNIPLSPSQYYSPYRKPIIFNDTPDGPIYRNVNIFPDIQTDYSDSDDDRKINKFYPSLNVLSYGHAPMSRHLARVQTRPKTVLYADRIRTRSQGTDTPLSLSYDRLHFNDVQHRTETSDKARPKSLCNNI